LLAGRCEPVAVDAQGPAKIVFSSQVVRQGIELIGLNQLAFPDGSPADSRSTRRQSEKLVLWQLPPDKVHLVEVVDVFQLAKGPLRQTGLPIKYSLALILEFRYRR